MIPVYQTRFGGDRGNCWPATIASILEIPQNKLQMIPNFCAHYPDDWAARTKDWLADFGISFFTCPAGKAYDSVRQEIVEGEGYVPSGWHGITGLTHYSTYHSVVGYDGEVIHDPFPGGLMLKEVRIWDLFIPFDPLRGVVIPPEYR